MKFLLFILLFFCNSAFSGNLYQCKDESGTTSYQDKPCKGETIKVTESKNEFDNSEFGKEMVRTLAKISGKSESDLQDPKMRQAAEILAATDAAKSYAFTKIYGVSAKYCPNVKADLRNYEEKAADIIKLGKYYYKVGIGGSVGGSEIRKSGQELTDGLNGMLSSLEAEHRSLNDSALRKKCREASQALRALAKVYSS